jgi:hypothetical protein
MSLADNLTAAFEPALADHLLAGRTHLNTLDFPRCRAETGAPPVPFGRLARTIFRQPAILRRI